MWYGEGGRGCRRGEGAGGFSWKEALEIIFGLAKPWSTFSVFRQCSDITRSSMPSCDGNVAPVMSTIPFAIGKFDNFHALSHRRQRTPFGASLWLFHDWDLNLRHLPSSHHVFTFASSPNAARKSPRAASIVAVDTFRPDSNHSGADLLRGQRKRRANQQRTSEAQEGSGVIIHPR